MWDKVAFGKIVRSSQYGLSIASSDNGGTPIIGMNHIQGGKILSNDLNQVEISDEEREAFEIKRNDLIFNRTNSYALVGKAAVAKNDMQCVFASYLVRFKLDESKVFPPFVGYVFDDTESQNKLKSLATPGVSQFNINPTTLKNHFYIPLPSFSEQRKISEILGAWDSAIDHIGKLAKARQKFKESLMSLLLTGRRRFKEFKSQKWREVRLGTIFRERRETNRTDFPLLSITADRGVIYRDELVKKDTSNADKSKYKRIAPGDIGYNTMRMWQGNSGVSKIEGIVSPAYTICIPKKDIDSDFAGYLFKYPPIIHLFYRFSQGLVSDTLNLKFKHFAQIRVKIPLIEEQKEIARTLKICNQEIEQIKNIQSCLEVQKRGLMQKLIRGKIEVPNDN